MNIKTAFTCIAVFVSACAAEPQGHAQPGNHPGTPAIAPAARQHRTISASELPQAQAILVQYLDHIRRAKYDSAVAVYAGPWLPPEWGYGSEASAENLGRACQAGILFCKLAVRRVAGVRVAASDSIEFMLVLSNEDGSRFEPPACCGDEGAGPDTAFPFWVTRRGTALKLVSLPIYRP